MSEDNILSRFFATAEEDNFDKIKHNKIDYDGFKKLQEFVDDRYEEVEREAKLKERSLNLKKWDNSLSSRWRGASLSTINNPAAKNVIEILKTKGKGAFFVMGAGGAGKTYLSYAIIRKYIGLGWITPSNVKILNEDILNGYAIGGFEGQAKFEKLFNPQYKLYLIDNIGEKSYYANSKTLSYFEQLIDYIYTNNHFVIFTSNKNVDNFSSILTGSSSAKFRNLVSERVVTISGTRLPSVDDYKPQNIEDSLAKRIDESFSD